MKKYTGTKTLLAKPMTRGEYNAYRGWDMPLDEDANEAGYLVEYTDGGKANHADHQGYISWSPADVFERSYKPSETHVERMKQEYADLHERSNKLLEFTRTETFVGLPAVDRHLMHEQFAAMTQYEAALGKRLNRAREKA